ncbi:hypothetical protein LINPERHAP2_LOCUS7441 [Linum perenne]
MMPIGFFDICQGNVKAGVKVEVDSNEEDVFDYESKLCGLEICNRTVCEEASNLPLILYRSKEVGGKGKLLIGGGDGVGKGE